MNPDLRKKEIMIFEKDSKLMNYTVFGKTMENVKKQINFKLVFTERRRNYLVSEPNYHTTKFSTENLLAAEMRKTDDKYKEIFEELVKERFDETKELTYKINRNELRYYFKGNTARKRFDDFSNGI